MKTQQQGNAYRHVAIAREVAINLKGVSINSHKVLNTRIKQRIVEDAIDKIDANIV